MAKSLLRFGRTPSWGLQHPEMTDTGSAGEQQVLFATNIAWTNETDEYVQKNHLGQDMGLILYDARLGWSMTANVDHEYQSTFQNFYAPAQEVILSNDIGKQLLESESGFGYDPADAVSVLKTVNITQTNDGATELSLDGTIFYFGGEG